VSDTVAEPRGLFVWFGCIPDRSACSGRGVSLDSAAEPFTHSVMPCHFVCIMFASRANMIILLFLTSVLCVCLASVIHTFQSPVAQRHLIYYMLSDGSRPSDRIYIMI
jgi:hypothetical protein